MKKKVIILLGVLFLITIGIYYFNKNKFNNPVEKKYLKTFLGKTSTIEIQCKKDSDCILTNKLMLYCQNFESINKNSLDRIKDFNLFQDLVELGCMIDTNYIKDNKAKCIKNTCSFIHKK